MVRNPRDKPIVVHKASIARAAALRSAALNFEKIARSGWPLPSDEVAQVGIANDTIKLHAELLSDDSANAGGGIGVHALPRVKSNQVNKEARKRISTCSSWVSAELLAPRANLSAPRANQLSSPVIEFMSHQPGTVPP